MLSTIADSSDRWTDVVIRIIDGFDDTPPVTTAAPPGVALPSTGSSGTFGAIQIAVTLLAFGAVLLAVRRRRPIAEA